MSRTLTDRLKPLDVEIMKRLGSRVNLIPVISKADTMTQEDLANFKIKVREVISAQGIKVYCPPIDEEDEGSAEHARQTQAVMPYSIIGSVDDVVTADGRTVKGREYLWGTAEGSYPEAAHKPHSSSDQARRNVQS